MRLRNYDNLRNFCLVARCGSFTLAAEKLNLTKLEKRIAPRYMPF